MSHEPIYEHLLHDVGHGWRDLTSHLSHRHATSLAQPPRAILAAQPLHDHTPEEPVSLLATLEADFAEVKAKVITPIEEFAATKLAPALSEATSLLDHPVVKSLLNAVHVPAGALDMAVQVIDGLEDLYRPDTPATAPADAATAAEPAPADTTAGPAATQPDAAQAAS